MRDGAQRRRRLQLRRRRQRAQRPTPTLAYNARNQTTTIGSTSEVYQGGGQEDLVKDGQIALQNNAMGVGVISDPAKGTAYITREPDGRLFSSLQNGKREYYLFDAQDDVVGMANDGGALDLRVRYTSPYDESDDVITDNVPNYFWFKSGYWTAGSYYHFGARFYEPWSGRWTQPDQIAHPADPMQYNEYGYVGSNPVNLSDPGGQLYDECSGIGDPSGTEAGADQCVAHTRYEARRANQAGLSYLDRHLSAVGKLGGCIVGGAIGGLAGGRRRSGAWMRHRDRRRARPRISRGSTMNSSDYWGHVWRGSLWDPLRRTAPPALTIGRPLGGGG